MNKKIKIFTDGGARGNPGPAGIGVAIFDDKDQIIVTYKKYIGTATNNQAEYQALILGLEKAKALKAEEIECCLDSELVVKQMRREYKVKNQDLATLFVKAWNLLPNFSKTKFTHVRREKNTVADGLVNEAIDERG
jgi:ribonuclease HI